MGIPASEASEPHGCGSFACDHLLGKSTYSPYLCDRAVMGTRAGVGVEVLAVKPTSGCVGRML